MALTDADRLQMTTLAVMRHSVFIQGAVAQSGLLASYATHLQVFTEWAFSYSVSEIPV